MPLYCRQENDGQQTGDEFLIEPLYEGQSAAELLQLKASSHQQKGWTVTWDGPAAFHAWKDYEWRSRKDRYFIIKE